MGIVGFSAVVVCLIAATIKGSGAVQLTIEPRDAIVYPGTNVTVLCRTQPSSVPLTYCRVKLPGVANALSLNPKTKPTKDYAYYGAGLQQGQCGVTLYNVNDKFNGDIVCTVATEEEAEESVAITKITVTRTPRAPELTVMPSMSSRGSNDYREGEILQASCVVRDARPVANITWYLGEDVISSGIRSVTDMDERTNLYTIKQNLTRKLSWKDNSRELRCVSGHISLGPKNQTGKTFNVRYAPRDIQMPIEQFGFVVGETGTVVVEILANPQPILTWTIGNIQLTEGERDKTGKLEAAQGEFIMGVNDSDVYSQGQGKWKAILYINEVTNEDTKIDYFLKAKNMEGEKKYRVTISTLTEPQAKILGMGGIIGIAVGVLVLLIIIIIIVVARATGRWCFAGGVPAKNDIKESSDTESAENGTLEKKKKNKPLMAQFFKKKNDKVAADPDEVKTVPMDDEKDSTKDEDNSVSEGKKDVVYAELDLQLTRSPVIIREEEKTEYAEILHAKQDGSP